MPKLFGVEVDDQMLEGLDDVTLLKGVNDYLKGHGRRELSENKLQKYFLTIKDQSKLTDAEKTLQEKNTERMDASDIDALKSDIEVVIKFYLEKGNKVKEEKTEEKKAEEKKTEENKTEERTEKQNIEENGVNLNQKAEEEKKKAEKIEEGLNDEKVENGPGGERNAAAEEQKTEEKKEEKKEEEKLDQKANTFAENVEKVQNAQEKMAGPAAVEWTQQKRDAILKHFYDSIIEKAQKADRGLLPGDEILKYMQDVQSGKELNAQNNGALEEQMLEKRADTIQNIGEEYQQNKKLTPKLVEQMSAVDAIDNVLISITRNPKLLFITVLLMGLNPFMALGMAVLSAFGNAVVQDLYQKLPETDRSNLENRPAQEQQPAYNPQFEACQKELAEARKQLKDQEMMLQKYHQKDMEAEKLRQMQVLYALLNREKRKQAEIDRINAEKAKTKPEAEAKKEDKKPEAVKEAQTEKKKTVKDEKRAESPVLKKQELKKVL